MPRAIPTSLQIRDSCLCLHLQRAARLLARQFDEAFRDLALTSGQFSLLNALDRPQPTTIGELAALLGMDRTTVTALVKVLVRDHRVRAASSGDRRKRALVLAPAGRATLAAARPIWRQTHARVEAKLRGGARGLRRALTHL